MSEIINIGVLGTANIATHSIIPSLISLNDKFKLTGVASRSKDKAENIAHQFGCNSFIGYDTLVRQENLDAVYIPLPNSLHFEWIDKALEKDLHVLVEKSLACNENDVKYLNDKAKEKGLVLFENFQFRFHPQLKKIQDLLLSSAIGELRAIRSSFGFPPFQDKNNIRYQRKLGGGALLDAGAYPIKISQVFMGDNIEVKAASLKMDKKSKVDIWGGGFLKQKASPLFSEIAFGFDHYYQCSIELWGSKGKISANRIFTAPPGYEAVILLEKPVGKEVIKINAANHFKNMLLHFQETIRTGKQRENEYVQNINQARLLEDFRHKAL